LIDGRLPIEISTRGARFAEEANGTAEEEEEEEEEEEAIRALEATTSELAQALTDAQAEIERLNGSISEDSTQREVNSKR
jgi:molecular chaperone GrpE (heat shock protein)